MNRALLFVFEILERSGTVSVILVDFQPLAVLFGDKGVKWASPWLSSRVRMLCSDGTVSSSIFLQSDNALTCLALVPASGPQTISKCGWQSRAC